MLLCKHKKRLQKRTVFYSCHGARWADAPHFGGLPSPRHCAMFPAFRVGCPRISLWSETEAKRSETEAKRNFLKRNSKTDPLVSLFRFEAKQEFRMRNRSETVRNETNKKRNYVTKHYITHYCKLKILILQRQHFLTSLLKQGGSPPSPPSNGTQSQPQGSNL